MFTIVSACEAEPVLVADETQPLLSDSAIRTRYASNPNEFARSYIDRPQHSNYASPHSLAVSPAALPYSPVENIVIVAPSDMSDSEDSGIDSCASIHSDERDAVQLEAATNEPHTNGPQSVDGSTTVGTLDPSLAQTSVAYSQPADCIDNDDTPSAEQGCLTGSNKTAASFTSSKPLKSINQRLAPHTSTVTESEGRSRSSSLNVNARVFVPSARSRTVVDAGREVTAPAAIMPIELSDAQMQALGRSMQSSRALGNSRRSSLSEAKTDVDTDKADNADSEREPSPAGTESNEITEAASAAYAPNRRCRFWPSCNNKNCKYSHPSRTCRMYPNCTFGPHCVFIHPCDAQRINDVISRGRAKRNKRKKNQDLVRLNNIGDFVN
ncbi:hypothetical protein H4S07_002274 [Coemansia furcata]|uniref:Uncharacterized protein n=1 Tax=Coemansia furcata TaxID=417177 RepID=A0ACC1LL05_9FUNG|nr:hypothetical protein H4S07_002274 [Coemansia furcata]